MNNSPIGVFDSGLGGLTAVRELKRILPGEDIVYFGDTGRVPYGNRGRDTIIAYARQDIAFLLSKGVKAILAACGTVSSTFPVEEGEKLAVGYMGVVEATVAAAAKATRNGRVGIIGTEATIASKSYQRALKAVAPDSHSIARACPLFVPLVENGHFTPGDPLAKLVAAEYLDPIKAAGVDTLILGCTHYPLLRDVLVEELGKEVMLVDPGREAALLLKEKLVEDGLLTKQTEGGNISYYVSDDPTRFDHLASIFLGEKNPLEAEQVMIETYRL